MMVWGITRALPKGPCFDGPFLIMAERERVSPAQPIAAHTAWPTCSVVAGAPEGRRSAVTCPLVSTVSIARSTAAASSFNPKLYSSMAATEPMAPSGLALFCPAISGADPWTGSYSPTQAPDGLAVADRSRRQHADRARQHRAFVAQNVAEHVLRQHDIEAPRVQHQLHGAVIHQQVVKRHIAEIPSRSRPPRAARAANFRARSIYRPRSLSCGAPAPGGRPCG